MTLSSRNKFALPGARVSGFLNGEVVIPGTLRRPASPGSTSYGIFMSTAGNIAHLVYYPFTTETHIHLENISFNFSHATNQPRGNMTNNQVAGYSLNQTESGSAHSTVKFSFPNWTFSQIAGVPGGAIHSWGGGCTNSGTAGYSGGGNANNNIVYKLSYSAETYSTLGATLTESRRAIAANGWSNVNTAGYFLGGYGASDSSTIDKITFSSDTIAAVANTLSPAGYNYATYTNGSTAGYAGQSSSAGTTKKWAFSTDTRSDTGITPNGTNGHSTGQNHGSKGYIFGGNGTFFHNKWTFSTDTVASGTALLILFNQNINFSNTSGLT